MVARFVILIILRGAWLSLMILTPLFGFWLASSLAAYNNGSQWLNLLLGLALFPLVPVGWELISIWRRSRQEQPGKQYLTRLDRLVLRTLIVNGLFLAVILYFSRATAFTALGQRGDWMLDGHDGPVASSIRGFLLGIADKLDGNKLAESERYGESDRPPEPAAIREDTPQPVKPGEVTPPKTAIGWPLDDAPDDKVTNMPESAKATIASVGAYLKDQFSDKKLRVKAIHDFVALRLVYDEKALEGILKRDFANVPPQDANAVFAARTGVCEGYARLMTAIGAAANVEIKYVTGYIRDASRRVALGSDASIKAALAGYGHAWNAVLLDGEWFLIDTTWDDPSGSPADKPVRSTYLFTPPKLFAYDHLPEDPAWQLVLKPISEGDFARLPMIAPEIGRYGMTLESPTRSQVSVSGRVEIVLDNPYGAQLLASAKPEHGGTEVECKASSATGKTTVACDLDAGEFEVRLFAAPAGTRAGRYGYIGSILVNSR